MLNPEDAERIADEAGLRGKMREAWLWKHRSGLTYAQIAAEMSVEEVTVRVHVSTATQRIRQREREANRLPVHERARQLSLAHRGPESVAHGRPPVGNEEDFEEVLRVKEGLPPKRQGAPGWALVDA